MMNVKETYEYADSPRPFKKIEGDQVPKCLRYIKNEGDMAMNVKKF